MRRDDKEVIGTDEIFDILKRCTTINVGINSGEYPYVIPMTFGCKLENDVISVYFHCAGEGRKWDLLKKDNRVCVEAHIYERVEMIGTDEITARFESVMGFGKACHIEDQKEKIAAMKIMLEHYNSSGFPATSCKGLSRVEAFRIDLEQVSGKRSK